MNYKMMGRFIGQTAAIEALLMLPPLGISLFLGEWNAVKGFLITLGITVFIGGVLLLLCRKSQRIFGAKEGLVCVGISWIVLSLLGCLPFVFSGQIPNYIDALFETKLVQLKDVEDISLIKFTEKDVVRHRLVQNIIKAYEKAANAR